MRLEEELMRGESEVNDGEMDGSTSGRSAVCMSVCSGVSLAVCRGGSKQETERRGARETDASWQLMATLNSRCCSVVLYAVRCCLCEWHGVCVCVYVCVLLRVQEFVPFVATSQQLLAECRFARCCTLESSESSLDSSSIRLAVRSLPCTHHLPLR